MLRPGKGIRANLTEEFTDYLVEQLGELREALDTFNRDDECTDLTLELEGNYDWDRIEDSYGKKAWTAYGDNTHEIRVSVIETPKGDLKIDIREWYDGGSDN
jgi:hypothetical protein